MFRMDFYYRINGWIQELNNQKTKITYQHIYFERETEFTKEEFDQSNANLIKAFASGCVPPISTEDIVLISKEDYGLNINKSEQGLSFTFNEGDDVANDPVIILRS